MEEGQLLLEVGTRVLVSRSGEAYNALLETEEAGTVLGVGQEYSNDETGVVQNDGILVKLQISNTRGIYPPSQVKLMGAMDSPAPTQRRSRRARVTPSPSVLDIVGGDGETEESLASRVTTETDENDRKRNIKDLESSVGDSDTAADVKKTKYFNSDSSGGKEEAFDKAENGGAAVSFRVQVASSSSSKCQQCNQTIIKNMLRAQPISGKRGWYHVSCAKDSIEGMPVTASDMEGFSDLSVGEQRLLQLQLSSNGGSDVQLEVSGNEGGESAEDMPLASLKRPASSKASSTAKKTQKTKQGAAQPKKDSHNDANSDDDMLRASGTDSDDLKDMPYRVEYSATGRAACRGCDGRIANGILRVAERPLFRGKAGFTVYRHLECTIFPDEIERLQDMGGWRRIKKQDRESIEDRIKASKTLVEKENQELQPDELVQVNFEGEIRNDPKGLSANLLPFQVEGFSWMVHQERHVPEIRGGILADEMVGPFPCHIHRCF